MRTTRTLRSQLPSSFKDWHKKICLAATESVAQLEDAHVTFQDAQGHERADVATLEHQPSYVILVQSDVPVISQGYPIEKINFFRCRHKFHFGADGES